MSLLLLARRDVVPSEHASSVVVNSVCVWQGIRVGHCSFTFIDARACVCTVLLSCLVLCDRCVAMHSPPHLSSPPAHLPSCHDGCHTPRRSRLDAMRHQSASPPMPCYLLVCALSTERLSPNPPSRAVHGGGTRSTRRRTPRSTSTGERQPVPTSCPSPNRAPRLCVVRACACVCCYLLTHAGACPRLATRR